MDMIEYEQSKVLINLIKRTINLSFRLAVVRKKRKH